MSDFENELIQKMNKISFVLGKISISIDYLANSNHIKGPEKTICEALRDEVFGFIDSEFYNENNNNIPKSSNLNHTSNTPNHEDYLKCNKCGEMYK